MFNGTYNYVKQEYMKLSLTSVLLNNKSVDMDLKTDWVNLKQNQNLLLLIGANVKFQKNFIGNTD